MEIFFLSYINETLYFLGNLPFFKMHVNCFMAGDDSPCAILSQNVCCGRGAWCNTLCLRHFFYLIAACYQVYAAAAAKSLQSCPTLHDPIDGSPPGSPIPGILQARTLEWVAISFSNAWKWKVKVKLLSPVRLLATPWTTAHQAPPSMGFSRQEYWSGLPLPSPIYALIYCLGVFLSDLFHSV